MAKSIKSLLNKKGWTGKEVGTALLMNLKNDIEHKGQHNIKPLFSQEDFNRMVGSLDTDYQYTQFKVLENIYSAIVDSFNFNEANIQQFYNGYYRYFLAIREAYRAEEHYRATEQIPLILTQAQYDRLTADSLAYKRGFTESYYSLFFHAVDYFLSHLDEDTTPENIRTAIEATQSQPVTNKRIIANWAEDMEEGYYTLKDGTRSDSMTSKEWKETLKAEFMETHKLYINGELADYETTIREHNNARFLYACQLLFRGEDAIRAAYKEKTGLDLTEGEVGELEQALEETIDGIELERSTTETESAFYSKDHRKKLAAALYEKSDFAEWHYYTEPPKDFTKYDVLAKMLDRYRGAYSDRLLESGGEYVEEIPEREQLKEFKKDYPALYDAVKAYLEGVVAPTKGLKANQLYKALITWGELGDMGFLDYGNLLEITDSDIIEQFAKEDTAENLNKRARAFYHGIAIIQTSKLASSYNPAMTFSYSYDTDEKGEYIDPVINATDLEKLQSIAYLEDNPDEADYIRANLDVLVNNALRYMYAYNAFIEIIADAYDVDFITVAKYDLTRQEIQIDSFNNLLYMLYKECYGTEDDKKRKRVFLREHFQPIEIEELKPTEDAIEALREKIIKLGYTREAAATFGNYRSLIRELMREGTNNE